MNLCGGPNKNKEWIRCDDEEVFIIWPRRMKNDGTVRALETVERRTALSYGYAVKERYRSADRLMLKGGDKEYTYYSLEDSLTLVERFKRGLRNLVKPIMGA